MRVLVCFTHLRKTTMQHGCVFDSVSVLFIPLWKLSFLRMYFILHAVLLCVSFHAQMLYISYVYNYCVFLQFSMDGSYRRCCAVQIWIQMPVIKRNWCSRFFLSYLQLLIMNITFVSMTCISHCQICFSKQSFSCCSWNLCSNGHTFVQQMEMCLWNGKNSTIYWFCTSKDIGVE